MKPHDPKILALAAFMLGAFLMGGCSMWAPRDSKKSTSVVEFLYPNKQPFVQPSVPTLSLPMRVGVVFVPSKTDIRNPQMPEASKNALMRTVSEQFKKLPYVSAIELIPTNYLRPGGSFENLDQLRSLLGVDVVALLAYDQQQVTTDSWMTLSYWTIVGAYTVQAQKNNTATLMEAVVYDIESRKLLFRAAGTSLIKERSTLAGLQDQLAANSRFGYDEAAVDLGKSLQSELAGFKVRIKESPEEVKVVAKPGYNLAAGTLGAGEVVGMGSILGLALLARLRRERRRPAAGRGQRASPPAATQSNEHVYSKIKYDDGAPCAGVLLRILAGWAGCVRAAARSHGLRLLALFALLGAVLFSSGCVSAMMLKAGKTDRKIFGDNTNPATRATVEKHIGPPVETHQLARLPSYSTLDEFKAIDDFFYQKNTDKSFRKVDIYYDRLRRLGERFSTNDQQSLGKRTAGSGTLSRYEYTGRIIDYGDVIMHHMIGGATWLLAEPVLIPMAAWTLSTGHNQHNYIGVWYDDSGLVVAYAWSKKPLETLLYVEAGEKMSVTGL